MSTDDNPSSSKRPFGLSFPSKPKSKITTTTLLPINKSCLAAAAFSLDDDDDMDTNVPNFKTNKPSTSNRLALNPKAQRDIEQALEQDPNIYEYDGIYEQVSSTVQQEKKREEKKRIERETNTVRQPKYVAGLLEKSKQREKDYEKVQERRIQRERELEGDLFADKEVFVTSAYKTKLAERQADLVREKLEDKREALLNVLQQDNMDAFYRYQFKVRTGDITILEESEKVKIEPPTTIKTGEMSDEILQSIQIFSLESSRAARQLRSRATNDDDEVEATASTDNDDIYTRAREKHNRATERERRDDVDEEHHQTIDAIPKSTRTNPAVKVRRINDETSRIYDDEQLEMGVGLGGKKNKKEKKVNTKENDVSPIIPIANETKEEVEETRIERIRRLCEKRTVGDVLKTAKQAYYERQEQRENFKDYIERSE